MLPFPSAPWTSSTALKSNCPKAAMWPPIVTHGYLQRAGARVEMCFCSMRNQTGKRTIVTASAGVSALQLCSLESWVILSPVPRLCPHAAPSHWAIQDCAEDRHLFLRYLRARPCWSCQPTELPAHQAAQGVLSVADCSQAYSAPVIPVLQTYFATRVQSWLLPQPEWPPGVVASSGRTRAGVSSILPWHCCSKAGKGKRFWVWHRGMACLCCAVVAPSSGV